MRKLVFLMIAVLVPLAVVPAMAMDLGKGVSLDATMSTGKLWDVHQNEVGQSLQYVFTTEKPQWYFEGETGATIPISGPIATRPFIRYSTLTNVYEQKGIGVDILYGVQSYGAVGLRVAYVTHRNSGLPTSKMLFTGLTFSLK